MNDNYNTPYVGPTYDAEQTRKNNEEFARRRLLAAGYSGHETENNIIAIMNRDAGSFLALGSEAKLKAKADEIFADYKERAGRIAYAAGPLGKAIFDKINEESYNKIQSAIDENPIKNWGILQQIDATKQNAYEILGGATSTPGALFSNPLGKIADSFGSTVSNVNEIGENLVEAAADITGAGAGATNPTFLPIILGGAAVVAAIILLR